jgi:hypothetical protein
MRRIRLVPPLAALVLAAVLLAPAAPARASWTALCIASAKRPTCH